MAGFSVALSPAASQWSHDASTLDSSLTGWSQLIIKTQNRENTKWFLLGKRSAWAFKTQFDAWRPQTQFSSSLHILPLLFQTSNYKKTNSTRKSRLAGGGVKLGPGFSRTFRRSRVPAAAWFRAPRRRPLWTWCSVAWAAEEAETHKDELELDVRRTACGGRWSSCGTLATDKTQPLHLKNNT